jgi:hypothetical protein
MTPATHQVTAGPHAGRDCWIAYEYLGGQWADVNLAPMRPWVFPEVGTVSMKHVRRIPDYTRAVAAVGEALL